MRRRVRAILLFLALGAAVNVAVAWGIVWWKPSVKGGDSGIVPGPDASGPYWLVTTEYRTGATVIWRSAWDDEGREMLADITATLPPWTTVHRPPRTAEVPESRTELVLAEAAFGLPLRSLMWEITFNVGRGTIDRRGDLGPVPIRPLVTGFVVNTVVFAALLWLLVGAPGAARRWRRRRLGLCTACGYDLRGAAHDRCPECGTTASAIGAGS